MSLPALIHRYKSRHTTECGDDANSGLDTTHRDEDVTCLDCVQIKQKREDEEALERVRNRPDWDQYFFAIAYEVARRATCPRAQVGAVIVSPDNRILATGYNGAPPGQPHCADEGCIMEDGHCQRALHAEVNAIAHAANAGTAVGGARIYIVGDKGRGICRECNKVRLAAGITEAIVR